MSHHASDRQHLLRATLSTSRSVETSPRHAERIGEDATERQGCRNSWNKWWSVVARHIAQDRFDIQRACITKDMKVGDKDQISTVSRNISNADIKPISRFFMRYAGHVTGIVMLWLWLGFALLRGACLLSLSMLSYTLLFALLGCSKRFIC